MPATFKPIAPRPFKRALFMNELRRGMKEQVEETQEDFDATIRTWDEQPEFEEKIKVKFVEIRGANLTDDETYRYVTKGTTRHWVEPVNAKVLAFPENYDAKTTPGVIGSTAGGGSGETRFSKGHWVSGIEARKFEETIASKQRPLFRIRMVKAIKRALRISGHGL